MSNLSAEDRITRAHISLMQDKRTLAYAGLLMIGKVDVSDYIPTAATNGRDVIYGRDFVDSLTDQEVRGLVLHENKHKMYQHLFVWRKLYEDDAELANMACDYVINLEIHDLDKYGSFIALPKCALLDEMYRGLDSGEVFAKLKQDKQDGKGNGANAGKPMDDHKWDDAQALDAEEQEALAKEIDGAIRTGALLAGKQGGDTDLGFESMMRSRVDWKEQLREFVSNVCAGKGDSTYARPNRRWLQHDIYLPSQISESVGNVCVGIDTSGSIGIEDITKALSELVTICDNTAPERVDLLYWDTQVAAHEQYREGDYDGLISSTKPKGGGGSSSLCVFDYIAENKLEPVVCIVITDGYVEYPSNAPSYPVIWVMVDNKHTVPPFGSVIRVD
jgi:predicted metal-dependent peptidase